MLMISFRRNFRSRSIGVKFGGGKKICLIFVPSTHPRSILLRNSVHLDDVDAFSLRVLLQTCLVKGNGGIGIDTRTRHGL